MSTNEFIAEIAPGAMAGWQQYGVLPSLSIAQGIHQSGWGRSARSAAPFNNLFNYTAMGWTEPNIRYAAIAVTKDGAPSTEMRAYRVYPNWAASVTDHASFLKQNSRYAKLIGVTDYRVACRLVKEAGYATDPEYANRLIRIIEQYGLTRFDHF